MINKISRRTSGNLKMKFGAKEKQKQEGEMLGLSLTIVRNNQNKFLAIKETRNRGWWIPGGRVDPPEDFYTAAIREC